MAYDKLTKSDCVLLTITDVDECAEQNGGCPQNCTNNVGNHTCTCFSGYTDVNDDGSLCTGNDYIGLLVTA